MYIVCNINRRVCLFIAYIYVYPYILYILIYGECLCCVWKSMQTTPCSSPLWPQHKARLALYAYAAVCESYALPLPYLCVRMSVYIQMYMCLAINVPHTDDCCTSIVPLNKLRLWNQHTYRSTN